MKSLTIIGRRWFQKTYSYTYCTACVLVDGKTVFVSEKQYGYGDFYIQVAQDWLDKNGYLPDLGKYENGSVQPLWQYCRDRGIEYDYQAIDVARERDL